MLLILKWKTYIPVLSNWLSCACNMPADIREGLNCPGCYHLLLSCNSGDLTSMGINPFYLVHMTNSHFSLLPYFSYVVYDVLFSLTKKVLLLWVAIVLWWTKKISTSFCGFAVISLICRVNCQGLCFMLTFPSALLSLVWCGLDCFGAFLGLQC